MHPTGCAADSQSHTVWPSGTFGRTNETSHQICVGDAAEIRASCCCWLVRDKAHPDLYWRCLRTRGHKGDPRRSLCWLLWRPFSVFWGWHTPVLDLEMESIRQDPSWFAKLKFFQCLSQSWPGSKRSQAEQCFGLSTTVQLSRHSFGLFLLYLTTTSSWS